MTASCNPYSLEVYRDTLEYALGVPFASGNSVEVLENGNRIFPAMLDAIASVNNTIDFATFVYWQGDIADKFADALAERAKSGIKVRVLLDAFGARVMRDELVQEMERNGVEVRWFRPLSTLRIWRSDKRTHRKLLICDGTTGFTGGVGIAEEWNGDARNKNEWRDTHLKIEGPAIRGLRAAFLDNWNESGEWLFERAPAEVAPVVGEVSIQVVRASTTIGWTDIACMVRTLIALSRQTLWITTAYFVPDDLLVRLLCDAAKRGVDVRILVPGKQTDSRLSQLAGQPDYQQLLIAGVRIFAYQQTLLHAKVMTIDGLVSCVGSANLNHRSLGKDEECCVVGLSAELCEELTREFESDCELAEEIELESWTRRGWWVRVQERFARQFLEQL